MRALCTLFLLLAPVVVQAAQPWIDLLPPADLKGWSHVPIPTVSGVNPAPQWKVDVAAKTLTCTGTGGHEWLVLDREFGDFVLEVDYRFTPKPNETKYNSGIGVRMSKEGELWNQAQTGLAGGWLFGQNFNNGVIERYNLKAQMKENRIKPAGEWNHYEIRVVGGDITLAVNGAVVSEVHNIGLRRGRIGFEAEGFEITFRNIRLQELDTK